MGPGSGRFWCLLDLGGAPKPVANPLAKPVASPLAKPVARPSGASSGGVCGCPPRVAVVGVVGEVVCLSVSCTGLWYRKSLRQSERA